MFISTFQSYCVHATSTYRGDVETALNRPTPSHRFIIAFSFPFDETFYR